MHWNKKEDEILRIKYPSADWNELFSCLPKRSKKSIYGRARKLCINRDENLWKRQLCFTIDKNILSDLYYIEGKNPKEIGLELACSETTVDRYMKRYDLKKRIRGKHFSHPKIDFMSLREWEKAYIAGILDGEGSIKIFKGRVGISIGNTDKILMDFLSSILKVNVFSFSVDSKSNVKEFYGLALNSLVDVYKFLITLLPFLITKKEKAIEAIKICFDTINELDDLLYHKIKEEIHLESIYPFIKYPIECEKGWYSLLNSMCREIQNLLDTRYPEFKCLEYPFEFSQIKEKYGTLHAYPSFANKEIFEIIDKYEEKSRSVCEICGMKGEMRDLHNWYQTLCSKCFKNKQKQNKNLKK